MNCVDRMKKDAAAVMTCRIERKQLIVEGVRSQVSGCQFAASDAVKAH